MSYYNKYIKYKEKYLKLKKQIGGVPKIFNKEDSKYYTNDINQFFNSLLEYPNYDLTMIIGYNILEIKDIERNLNFDIALDIYDDDVIKHTMNTMKEEDIKYYVLNYNLNNPIKMFLSKFIISPYQYLNINKINLIVFDASVFKFMNRIDFLFCMYYYLLNTGGSIYIEANNTFSQGNIIRTDYLNENCFYCASGSRSPIFSGEDLSKVKTDDQIYEHNKLHLQEKMLGSVVEVKLTTDEPYPISHPDVEITKYYKITKIISNDDIIKIINESDKETRTFLVRSLHMPKHCIHYFDMSK